MQQCSIVVTLERVADDAFAALVDEGSYDHDSLVACLHNLSAYQPVDLLDIQIDLVDIDLNRMEVVVSFHVAFHIHHKAETVALCWMDFDGSDSVAFD